MTSKDSAGHMLTGATPAAVDAYEQAAHELRCLAGDLLGNIERAIAAAPGMPMAHLLKAWVYLLATEPAATDVARQHLDTVSRLPADDRERSHLHAARLLAGGRWHAAGLALEDHSVRWPRDALALQAGHQIDFFTGNARMLRDRIARALPHWSREHAGYHALLGMHAFGLEETGRYDEAEAQGRRAVELQPRDSWAWHAVAHVMEMRSHSERGIDWLEPNAATWSPQSFLGVHLWWHLALFRLELQHADEALRLYDTAIGGPGSTVVLDLLDQSALLWRLHLLGIDAGPDRWNALADRWTPFASAGNYAFNDLHAMIAFVGAGRASAQQTLLDTQQAAMQRDGDNAAFTRDVGRPAALAVQAFGQGRHADSVTLLRSIRSHAHRFGGSHAQRDLLDWTLLEASLRGGDSALASALAAERHALRPASPLAAHFVARANALPAAAA